MPSVVLVLSEVRRLLGKLPEVTIAGGRISGDKAILEIDTHSASAALTVQQLCEAANVSFEPAVRPDEPEQLGKSARVLLVSNLGFDTIQHGNLQLLAIHLVWHLRCSGVIQAQTASDFLGMWHGARVGA